MKYYEKVGNLFKVNNEDTRGTSMFLNVSVSVRLFWWIQLYLNLFQHLSFHDLFHLVHSEVHNKGTCVPPNVTRSTKLQQAKHSAELLFRSMDFCVPENLIFLADSKKFNVLILHLILVWIFLGMQLTLKNVFFTKNMHCYKYAMLKIIDWVKYQSPRTVFSLTKFDFIFHFLSYLKDFETVCPSWMFGELLKWWIFMLFIAILYILSHDSRNTCDNWIL